MPSATAQSLLDSGASKSSPAALPRSARMAWAALLVTRTSVLDTQDATRLPLHGLALQSVPGRAGLLSVQGETVLAAAAPSSAAAH
jgi:hypothetical protein